MIKNVIKLTMGGLMTNTFIVVNDNSECLVIDLGGNIDNVLKITENLNVKILAVLFTHGHFDHTMGAKSADNRHIALYIGKKDIFMPKSKISSLAPYFGYDFQPVENLNALEEGEYKMGGFTVEVMETGGHTPGSVCYLIEDCIFTGDTLFKNGFGRCDLPYGDYDMLKKSLKKLSLLDNKKVFAGHGEETTLYDERNILNND